MISITHFLTDCHMNWKENILTQNVWDLGKEFSEKQRQNRDDAIEY